MRFFIVILVTALCWQSFHGEATAADDPLPTSLLGFVKPGMHIGVRFSQQDSFVSIEIFNEDQFRLAQDARDMSLEALGQKYPHIADKASKSLAEHKSSVEALRSQDPKRTGFPPLGEPSVALEVDRTIVLCHVVHVAEDYVLIAYGADNSKKQVIAKQVVSRIRWASDDLQFRHSLKRTETQK
jgi:hypothetical protein